MIEGWLGERRIGAISAARMVQVVMNGAQEHHAEKDLGLSPAKANGKQLVNKSDTQNINNASSGGNDRSDDSNDHAQSESDRKNCDGGRKLTKNEKRRQKNRQRKAEAQAGSEITESMRASNGTAVATWPPPAENKDAKDSVQVCAGFCFKCLDEVAR